MCGIAGFFSNDINFETSDKYKKTLTRMKKSLYHRGPDDSGIYLREHCGLAHTRLAIRDVKNGRQPMKRTINNNDYVVVYNGEIYNTDILRKELKKQDGILNQDQIQKLYCFYFCNMGRSL